VSYTAIAAVLARDDLSTGERLAASSLASFADREQRAWPGTPVAAARAGLSHSGFLAARERLVSRGLVAVEEQGRSRASTLTLLFARSGPWWDSEINAELFEAVLGYSRTAGAARSLLAALAALAGSDGLVDGLSTATLCRAAGLADSTYRCARATLLSSGEAVVAADGGGRGRTNRWRVPHPNRELGRTAPARGRRVPPPRATARPLVAAVALDRDSATSTRALEGPNWPLSSPAAGRGPVVGRSDGKPRPAERTVALATCPDLTGVSGSRCPDLSGVSERGCPDVSGVSASPGSNTPPETPPPNARAGREPLNPRTKDPPSPPEGGSAREEIMIEGTYTTPRGRRRRRLVAVDLDAVRTGLRAAGPADHADWERIREQLAGAVGESMFEIWLEPLDLRALDLDGALLIAAPAATRAWLRERFGRLLAGCAERIGRQVVIADEAQTQATAAGQPSADLSLARFADVPTRAPTVESAMSACPSPDAPFDRPARASASVQDRARASPSADPHDCGSADSSASASYDSSACPLSYTSAYNPTKEAV
jgi:DnaA N-terminal domain